MAHQPITIKELKDIPPPESNCSDELFLQTERGTFLIYEANPHDEIEGYVVLELVGCRALHSGGPNDEALQNHRYYRYGLQHYSFQEVVNSDWPCEHADYLHRDGRVKPLEARHFVFALKEGCIDCLAKSYRIRGVYPTSAEAFQSVIGGG